MAYRSPTQLARRRRIERAIRVVAPALDVVLFVGDRVSRIAGRDEIAVESARRRALPSKVQ